MAPDGTYLSGHFGRASREQALKVINEGWSNWIKLAQERKYQPKPVPVNELNLTMGPPTQPGGMKLEVSVRDLPRGNDLQPGQSEWEKVAFNINWIDLDANEVKSLLPKAREAHMVPTAVFTKLATQVLKDNVRGQCNNWANNALTKGHLNTEWVKQTPQGWALRLSGEADLREDQRAYSCTIRGWATFDPRSNRFVKFEIVAVGQRSGSDQFNFRKQDPGPAPMGVALVMVEDLKSAQAK